MQGVSNSSVQHLNSSEVMAFSTKLRVWKLGLLNYPQALALQHALLMKRRTDAIRDTLLSLHHPPTYTLGKRRTAHNILSSPAHLQALGATIHISDRGGDATFHGPGQAILYPILNLRRLRLGVRRYVEGLEDCMIKVAGSYGVLARGRVANMAGVWVGDRKIGAVGVRVSSGGISSHGLAFNIMPDLQFFSHIIPCGIPHREVTSLEKEAHSAAVVEEEVTVQLIEAFAKVFGFDHSISEPDDDLLASVESITDSEHLQNLG